MFELKSSANDCANRTGAGRAADCLAEWPVPTTGDSYLFRPPDK
jgi:hypothetical protein